MKNASQKYVLFSTSVHDGFGFLFHGTHLRKCLLIISLLLCCLQEPLYAQVKLKREENTIKKDSVVLYQNLYRLSKQSDFNRLIYRILFRGNGVISTDTISAANKNEQPTKPKQTKTEEDYQGKIIRDIIIVAQAPFEIDDEEDGNVGIFTEESASRVGNSIHANSRSFTIRNLLLFRKNTPYDRITIQESERLIRSQRYIERCSIVGLPVAQTDSVDIIVTVRDAFSLIPEGQLSASAFGLGIRENNFLGLGHRFHTNYSWAFGGGINRYQYDYDISNLKNTYINPQFIYEKNHIDTTQNLTISVNRPFYSSLAVWAGGVSYSKQRKAFYSHLHEDVPPSKMLLLYTEWDHWFAYAMKIKSRNYEHAHTRNITFAARYNYTDFADTPPPEKDPANTFTKENLYLFSVSVSERRYKKDRYLFKYGFVEDVPIGKKYELVAGVRNKNHEDRFYLALKLSQGNYFKYGYFGWALEYGSFFTPQIKEGVFAVELNYFSPVIKVGNWRIRQFVKPQLLLGINRLPTERLYLNDYYGLNGFRSTEAAGKQKFVCSFQTQFYPPLKILGFRIGPYLSYTMGVLGEQSTNFSDSKFYSLLGLGLLIRNDYLVFNSFEFSLSFYPYIPGDGSDVFKFNNYQSQDFGIRDFDIKEPIIVPYE